MSMLFDKRGVIVLLARATAISLSQRRRVGGCGYPRLWRIERSLSAKRAAAKMAAF